MKVILELCCWKLCSVGKVHQTTFSENTVTFSEMFKCPPSETMRNNGPLLPKKKTNGLVVNCVFLIDL